MLKRTSAEEIRREIAARVVGGQLAPGTALDETQLAADFAVSRTPVREALRLLAASGLVEQRPHARAIVAQPSEAKLRGMFEVMGDLEALCAGKAAVAMDGNERTALDALHTAMAAIVHAGDAQRYAEANDLFHGAIYDGAHNPSGMHALVQALDVGARPLIAVVSILDDKDAAGMLRALLGKTAGAVFTSSRNSRALSPATLASLASQLGGPPSEIVPDPHAAVLRAQELAGPGGAVLATGSIYLVADLLGEPGRRRASAL